MCTWRRSLIRFRQVLLCILFVWRNGAAATQDLRHLIESFRDENHIPGIAVAVSANGSPPLFAGVGLANIKSNEPVTADTLFEIGSMTKTFTAQAIMLLVERRLLGLNEPIGRYLQGVPKEWHSISVLHLLTHVSGLHDWEGNPAFSFDRDYTLQEFIELIAGRPLDFPPGSRWSYTNSAYPLLGAIIEKVSGQSYEQFVTTNIFRKLKLTQTRFRTNDKGPQLRASGYVDRDGSFAPGIAHRPLLLAANGGILSSIGDLSRWVEMTTKPGFLQASSLQLMRTPVQLTGGTTFPYGIGWFMGVLDSDRVLMHNGSTVAGFSSVIYHYLDRHRTIIVLMNVDRGDAVNRLAAAVARALRTESSPAVGK